MGSALQEIENYLGSPQRLPEAVGYLRNIQRGALKLLVEFDRICTQAHLQYFICFGTLLGAVRTGRFVPWDDDIDVAMPRRDYLKIISVFNRECILPGVHAELYTHENGIWNVIKIVHEEIPSIFIDIFAVDACYKALSFDERLSFDQDIKRIVAEHIKGQTEWPSIQAYHQSLYELALQKIEGMQPVQNIKPSIFFGIEFIHSTKFSSFDFDVVFPLRQIKFEGHQFWSVNDPDLMLTYLYGDYERLPGFCKAHSIYDELSLKEMIRLKEFIRPKNKKGRK